nr:hypothetical protein [Tanacetum cinerariifolium]
HCITKLAFVSSTSTDSTTDSVSAAASISTACVKLPAFPLPNIDVDDLEEIDLRWQMAMLTMRARRKGHFARECRSPKDSRRPGSYDWSYQAEDEPVNFALLAFSSNSSFDNEVPSCSKACSKAYAQLHTQYDKLTDDFQKSQFDVISYKTESDCESWPPSNLYDRFQPSGGYHAVPPLYTGTFMPPKPDLPIETSIPAATSVPASSTSNGSGKRRNRKACFVCKSVDHLIKDYDYHSKQMAQPTPRNYANRGHHKQYAPLNHSKPQKHRVPTIVLTLSKPVSNTAVRPVSAALPNIIMTRPRHAHQVVTKSKSPIRRHITRNPSSRTSNSPPGVNAVQVLVVSAVQGKQGTWGKLQQALKDKGVIDSRCSRHMTGNMSYLSDFEELNRGYVAFGGAA